jgi:hypothetical protein
MVVCVLGRPEDTIVHKKIFAWHQFSKPLGLG